MNNYVAKRIEALKRRNLDSSKMTSARLASVLGYPALSALIPTARESYSDSRDAVRAYSKFWIEFLTPPSRDPFMAVVENR